MTSSLSKFNQYRSNRVIASMLAWRPYSRSREISPLTPQCPSIALHSSSPSPVSMPSLSSLILSPSFLPCSYIRDTNRSITPSTLNGMFSRVRTPLSTSAVVCRRHVARWYGLHGAIPSLFASCVCLLHACVTHIPQNMCPHSPLIRVTFVLQHSPPTPLVSTPSPL
jgi:hypothetical protein